MSGSGDRGRLWRGVTAVLTLVGVVGATVGVSARVAYADPAEPDPVTFATHVDYANAGAISVVVADVNLDLVADLVSTSFSTSSVSVLLGTGSGGFGAPIDTSTGGTSPEAVGVVDVNTDTIPDAIASNFGSNNVSVLLGDGTGHFGALTQYATGTSPWDLVVSDFNGDTHPDVATVNANSNRSAFRDRSDPEISTATRSPTSSSRAGAQAGWRFCWATGTEPSDRAPWSRRQWAPRATLRSAI
jgi:hypothetical protein